MGLKFTFGIVCFVALMQHASVWCETGPSDHNSNRARRDIFGRNFGRTFATGNDVDPFQTNNYFQPMFTSQTFDRRCVNNVCDECVNGQCGRSDDFQVADNFDAASHDFGLSHFGQSNTADSRLRNFYANGRSDSTFTSTQYNRTCTNDVCQECLDDVCERCVNGKCRYNGNLDWFNASPISWNAQSALGAWNRDWGFRNLNENERWEERFAGPFRPWKESQTPTFRTVFFNLESKTPVTSTSTNCETATLPTTTRRAPTTTTTEPTRRQPTRGRGLLSTFWRAWAPTSTSSPPTTTTREATTTTRALPTSRRTPTTRRPITTTRRAATTTTEEPPSEVSKATTSRPTTTTRRVVTTTSEVPTTSTEAATTSSRMSTETEFPSELRVTTPATEDGVAFTSTNTITTKPNQIDYRSSP